MINRKAAVTISAFKIGTLFKIINFFFAFFDNELIPIADNVPKIVEIIVDKTVISNVKIIESLNSPLENKLPYHLNVIEFNL